VKPRQRVRSEDARHARGVRQVKRFLKMNSIIQTSIEARGKVSQVDPWDYLGGVCVECLIGKQKKPILFKVTEPSSIPYRTPPACHGL